MSIAGKVLDLRKGERLAPSQHIQMVILGAGASVAAFPEGDAEGRCLPTMLNLIEVVGLSDLVARVQPRIETNNFEDLYGTLFDRDPGSHILREIEERVFDYFDELSLPREATLYDRLLLSLRTKDVVATFNWDPFLHDAVERVGNLIGWDRLPLILHLHGNVRVGYCPEHVYRGDARATCPECGKRFTHTRLLYPVQNKDYADSAFLRREWHFMREMLARCFTMTIFGYGAPKSDVKAINELRSAWKKLSAREVHNIQIIDIKDRQQLAETWKDFIFSHHWQVRSRLEDSFIGTNPRRSAERVRIPTIDGGMVVGERSLPQTNDLPELVQSVQEYFDEEEEELQRYREKEQQMGRG